MSEVRRYGVHYEDLHDGVEVSDDDGVVSMVQTSDHLAAVQALEARVRELESENITMYGAILEAADLGSVRCKLELQSFAADDAREPQ